MSSNKTVKIEIGKVEQGKGGGRLRITLSEPLPEEEMDYMMSVLKGRIGSSCREDPIDTFNALVPFPNDYAMDLVQNIFMPSKYRITLVDLEENPKDNLVTVWITGDILHEGKIYESTGTIEKNGCFQPINFSGYYNKHCYHRTKEEAVIAAEDLRKTHLTYLRNRIAEYEALVFEIVKMEQ